MTTDLPTLSINTIRTLAMDAIQKANSGHPGLPMGCAPMGYVLWQRHLKFDPRAPQWPDRDRFVLSAGHGSMLLYSLLHLTGYDLPLDELKNFRQWESKTPGHPEWHLTPGVEATTGPLGQGAANAVGMALAEKYLAHVFNRPGHTIIDHHTYALVSDGDVMEGVACEAASIAGHLGLGKLTYLYDANQVTLDGPLSLVMSEDVGARYAACGWHVQHVENGNTDLAALDAAIQNARAETERPSLIVVKTTIGYGSPKKAGTSAAHGSPLGDAEIVATKTGLGWDPNAKFLVPDEVRAHMADGGRRGAAAHSAWREKLTAYKAAHPDLAAQLEMALEGKLPAGWDAELPSFTGSLATRSASGKVMAALTAKIPWLFGGDADLGGSTKTIVPSGDFSKNAEGRNLRFGIREHAMGAIGNGMLYHGGIRPYVSTFFVFSDYMRPSVRLAALNSSLTPFPAIFVWTHDSVGLGEDGPTHQPVEHLMALRAMHNLTLFRPADGNETAVGWRLALTRKSPTGLVLSRQDLPTVTQKGAPGAERGAYVLADGTDVILMSSGSEVSIALGARDLLAKENISARVVSMPSWEIFDEQDAAYKASVLPPARWQRVSVEAGVTFGWRQYIGERGIAIGVDRFGASAPYETIYEHLGLTPANVAAAAKKLVR